MRRSICLSNFAGCSRSVPVDRRRSIDGFTLIELMITVAIVAILAAIAIPSYSEYMRRGQLPEAFSFLSDYRVKMEQYYQDNRNYGVTDCVDTNTPASWNFTPQARQYFDFRCELTGNTASGGRQGYTVIATGRAGNARGHEYRLTSGNGMTADNVKQTTVFKGAAMTPPRGCWLVKGNEC